MTKPRKDVKFARRMSRPSHESMDGNGDAHAPSRNGNAQKPSIDRTISTDGAWTDDEKPPGKVEPSEYEKKKQTFITRTIWTLVMIGIFFGSMFMGHIYIIMIVTAVQIISFKEVIAIAQVPSRARRLRFTKSLNWYFLGTTMYFLYGESVIYYFKHIILVDKVLLPFATHHRFISFMLYIIGFVFFVTSLEKGHYKFQFTQFAWTHMALYLIVVQAHFIMNNIFEGMIWFFLPVSLVITNDIFAYICGITFGRTQLIKISPKKTVEGFVGAWLFTILFGIGLTNVLMRYKYFICPVNDLGANVFTGLECEVNPVFIPHRYRLPFIPPHWTHLPTTITAAPMQFHILTFATFASLIAPFGGFFASGLKRTFNIKDFGDSIPGHGGMTDRMDCQFIMGFFAFMYYQSFVAVHKASVGGVIELAITGLTSEQQVDVLKGLSKHLVNQGVISQKVLKYLGEQLKVYTASFAFFEAIWEAGVTHCFVNLGSDHPSIIEAMVKGQNEKKGQFPRIITCPNEMVALSLADGYARLTSRPQAVIIHVDVGTQGLGAAVHNASCGRAPVLIFAGLSPVTIEGEYRGSRTEYIHWIQDVPDQKAIVAQYCRYSGEIKRGRNVKQMVNRALSFAKSQPMGPVYLVGARESMEEDLEPYSLKMENWTPVEGAALTEGQAARVAESLVSAEEPLLITGYSGRNHQAPGALRELADTVRGMRVLDTGGSDMCFPADHPGWLGLRYGVEEAIKTADVILVLDCDVPWIPTQCKPRGDAKIVHIDVDPLKQQMPVFYIDAQMRFRADAETSIRQITKAIKSNTALSEKLASKAIDERWAKLQEAHQSRLQTIKSLASPAQDGSFNTSYLASRLSALLPKDTIYAVEAVTNAAFVHDQIQPVLPGTWINCGGGGLGWSGGGALGIKLASDFEAGGKGKGKFVCQIVGDGTFLFSVPGSVYWIAQKYEIPVLTIVLNNKGWNAPRKSLLLVHPDGQGSKATNEELNISFAPTPDYAGIAAAASGHKAWAGQAWNAEDLESKLKDAISAVSERGVCAVLDAHLEGPDGKFGGGKAALVG
ncbi:hypothetical protein CAC42_4884 [Sphaceloma murrayae]|uniref:Phosphatidate cytidylyltransferase n=1 Tax=Sphaceloma murrayae TaxID=2082308 RepID=A0A2K1QPR4_9PEZI|nr:hypothetical protein CAC42_4884 [Sphaceloma murrayae]